MKGSSHSSDANSNEWMKEMLQNWEVWARSGSFLAGAVVILAVHYVVFRVIERFSRRTPRILDTSLVRHCRGPARLVIPLVVVSFVLPHLTMSPTLRDFMKHLLSLCFIWSAAWFIIEMTSALDDPFLTRMISRQRITWLPEKYIVNSRSSSASYLSLLAYWLWC